MLPTTFFPPKPAPSSQVVLLPIFLGVGFNTVAPKICKAQFATSTVMAKVDPQETSLQGGPPTSYKCYKCYNCYKYGYKSSYLVISDHL